MTDTRRPTHKEAMRIAYLLAFMIKNESRPDHKEGIKYLHKVFPTEIAFKMITLVRASVSADDELIKTIQSVVAVPEGPEGSWDDEEMVLMSQISIQ